MAGTATRRTGGSACVRPWGRPSKRLRQNRRSARFGIHVGRIVAYVWSRPCVQRYSRPAVRPPHLGSRPRPGPGLSSGLIHPRPPPFTDVHSDRVRAVGVRWRTLVNAMQHCWKACWGQPLRSSNLLSSAILTCDDALGSWSRAALRPRRLSHFLSQFAS